MDPAQAVLQVGGQGNPPPISPPAGAPLILQVFPPPGSSDPEEFFYDPFANNVAGDFAAACVFFVKNGHNVVVHGCPDLDLFQQLFPGATLQYLSLVPPSILSRGHAILQAAVDTASHAVSATVVAVPQSFLDHYRETNDERSSVAGATFGLRSPTRAPCRPDLDRIDHSTIMPWDSFSGCSARPMRS
jgi:hypothetical protein